MDLGIIIDVETTGLDAHQDEIVEVGVIQFGIEQGESPFIIQTYGGLQETKIPLTPQIEQLTGIKNSHIKGTQINWAIVAKLFEESQVIIAHNAPFDRNFLAQVPELADKVSQSHWACSLRHIDWKGKGFRSLSLSHLACDHGYINPFAHRAVFDCLTTFKIVTPYFNELLENSYLRMYKINALSSPFEKKDILKQHGYFWNNEERVWCKNITENQLTSERDFLAKEIYGGLSRHHEQLVSLWTP